LFRSKVVAIAAGLGSFEPRKPDIPGLEQFERKGIDYFVKDPGKYVGRKVVIAGGGDSALDWTIELAHQGAEVSMIHRRSAFRGAPDSVDKVMKLVADGKVRLYTDAQVTGLEGQEHLEALLVETPDSTLRLTTDYFIPLFGLTPKLGPIADWGLELDKNAIVVNPTDCSTNIEGVFAIGDI